MSNTETDYEKIAYELANRLNFAIAHFDFKAGVIYHRNTGQVQGWRQYFADGLEMLPGVKIDREILNAMDLPKTKRKKEIKRIQDKRAVEKSEEELIKQQPPQGAQP